MFIILIVSTLMFTLEITQACRIFQLHSDESASPTMFAFTQANNNIELTVDMTNLTDSVLQITGGHDGRNYYNVIKNVTDNPNVTISDLSVKELYTVSIPSLNLSTDIRFACNPSCCSICSPIIMDITGIRNFYNDTYLVQYRINTTAYPEVGSIQYTETGTLNSYISLLKYVNKTHEGLLIEMKDLKRNTDYTLELIIYDIYNPYCESISSITFHVPQNQTEDNFTLFSFETETSSILSKREAAGFLSTREYAFVATIAGVLLILLAILSLNVPIMSKYLGGSKQANLEKISVKSINNSFHSVAATSRASTCSGRQEINVLYTPLEEIEKPAIDQYEFPRKNIELKSKIGGGAFGEVYYSKAHGLHGLPGYTLVAVKILKEHRPKEEVEAFLAEINMLKRIGTHRNIVKLLGCVTKSEPKMAIMELVMNGDLSEYLLNIRKKWNRRDGNVFFIDSDGAYIEAEKPLDIRKDEFFKETVSNPEYLPSEVLERCSRNPRRSISPVNDEMMRLKPEEKTPKIKDVAAPPEPSLDNKELENFALQIATGMAYLEKIGIVHRDLAARNILITRQKTLKITDFGMSRFGTYINRNFKIIPLRWMALEALLQFKTDNKTDVWSFAVVLWEIGTLGAYPYSGMNNDQIVPYLLSGQRLNRPETCTDNHYALMLKCWNVNPDLRPSFEELVEQLSVTKHDAYVDFSKINPNYVFPPIDPTKNLDIISENINNNNNI